MPKTLKLRANEWVQVRSKQEILNTLDSRGRLDGMPFMPQMFDFCGKRFRVHRRAHKTCDTVNQTGGRWVTDAVHLETRCDGQAYGGCQAGCLLFWKEAWLRRVHDEEAPSTSPPPTPARAPNCTEQDVWTGTQAPGSAGGDDATYVCQATEIPNSTQLLKWWDIRQYVEDYTSGNVGMLQLMRGALYAGYYNLSNAGIGLGKFMRWFYEVFQSVWGGPPYPRWKGTIPAGQRTPHGTLDLQPGELVRVRPYKAILETLDTNNKNRGLYFDAEAVPFCEKSFRVLRRVNRIVDEKTGKLVKLKNESVILDGVACQARYSDRRMFCPRGIYSYWRELWLERVPEGQDKVDNTRPRQSST